MADKNIFGSPFGKMVPFPENTEVVFMGVPTAPIKIEATMADLMRRATEERGILLIDIQHDFIVDGGLAVS